MTEIVRLFWQICLFQKGPQNVPASSALYYFILAVYFVVSLLMTRFTMNWSTAITNSLLGLMLTLSFIWLVLTGFRKIHRFYPVASALFGIDALITLLSLPFFAAVVFKFQPGVAFLFLVLFMIWQWSVMVNVIKSAVSTSYAVAGALVLTFVIGSFKLLHLVSGGG